LSIVRQLIKNTNYSFISNFIRIVFGFIAFALIARVVGVEDFGKLTFSVTFTLLFLPFMNFGFDRLTILDVARDQSLIKKYFGNIVVTKVFISLIALALMWLIINLMGYPNNTKLLVYELSIATILTSFTGFLNSIYRGIEKLEYESIVTFISNTVLIILTLFVLYLTHRIVVIGFVFLFSRLVAFVYSVGIYKYKIGKLNFSFDYNYSKELSKKVLPFALFSVLTEILFAIDTVLLSYMRGDQFVGYYQASMKIIVALTVIPEILYSSFFPTLSKLYEIKNASEMIGEKLMTILLYIGVPLTAIIFILADKIILFVYGDSFSESIVIFKILSVALLLRFVIKGYETILFAIGKQTVIFYIVLFATVFNIILNILSIQRFGLLGAAYSSVATQIVIFAAYFFVMKRVQGKVMLEKSVFFILLAGFLSILLIYEMKSFHLFFLITIYALSYLIFTLFFMKNERLWIYQRIKSHITSRKMF
jgi:O-antigen/teichoic acid export membrane protein